jgi:hypothetical protein
VRLAGQYHPIGVQPLAIHAHAESGGRPFDRFRAGLAHVNLASDCGRDGVHELTQTAFQRAE